MSRLQTLKFHRLYQARGILDQKYPLPLVQIRSPLESFNGNNGKTYLYSYFLTLKLVSVDYTIFPLSRCLLVNSSHLIAKLTLLILLFTKLPSTNFAFFINYHRITSSSWNSILFCCSLCIITIQLQQSSYNSRVKSDVIFNTIFLLNLYFNPTVPTETNLNFLLLLLTVKRYHRVERFSFEVSLQAQCSNLSEWFAPVQ